MSEQLLQQEQLILEMTELLATIMAKVGVSRSELARRMGKTKAHVTQILSGRNVTLRTLADAAGALGYRIRAHAEPAASNDSSWSPTLGCIEPSPAASEAEPHTLITDHPWTPCPCKPGCPAKACQFPEGGTICGREAAAHSPDPGRGAGE